MKLKERYELNKSAKVGADCICPSCNSKFVKTNYQQAFCKRLSGTKCKDKYWNTVTPTKHNNKTRISPASIKWLGKQAELRYNEIELRRLNSGSYKGHFLHEFENAHPFSSEALGQWD